MLINTRGTEFSDEYEQVQVKNYTSLMWMPINSKTSISNLITFENHQFWKKETE